MKKYIEIKAQMILTDTESARHYGTSIGPLEKDTVHMLGTVNEIPEWSHGQKVFDCDGEEGVFIGPSANGGRAIVQYKTGPCEAHWCDICKPEDYDAEEVF